MSQSMSAGVMDPYRQRERERERPRSDRERERERERSREERDARPVSQKDKDKQRQKHEAQIARLNTRNNVVNGTATGYQDDGMPVFPRASALDTTDPTAERARRLFGDFDSVRSLVNKKGPDDLLALQKTNGYHLDGDSYPEDEMARGKRHNSRSSSLGRQSSSSRHSGHSDRSSKVRRPVDSRPYHGRPETKSNEGERRKEERRAKEVNGVVEKHRTDVRTSVLPPSDAIPSPASSTTDAPPPRPVQPSPDLAAISSILREMTFPDMYRTLISPITSPSPPRTLTPPRPVRIDPLREKQLKDWGLDVSDSETSSAEESASDHEEGEIKTTTSPGKVTPVPEVIPAVREVTPVKEVVPEVTEVVREVTPVKEVVREPTPIPPQSPLTDESFCFNLGKLTQVKLGTGSRAPSPGIRRVSPPPQVAAKNPVILESGPLARKDSIEEGELSPDGNGPKHSTPQGSPNVTLLLGSPLTKVGPAISPIPKNGKKSKSRGKSTSRGTSRRASGSHESPVDTASDETDSFSVTKRLRNMLTTQRLSLRALKEAAPEIVESSPGTSKIPGGSPTESIANQTMMLDDGDLMDLDEEMPSQPLIVEQISPWKGSREKTPGERKESSPPNWENTVKKKTPKNTPPLPPPPQIVEMVQRMLKLKPKENVGKKTVDFVVKFPLGMLDRVPLKPVNGEKNVEKNSAVVLDRTEKESTPAKVSTPPTGLLKMRLPVKRPPPAPEPPVPVVEEPPAPVETPPAPTPALSKPDKKTSKKPDKTAQKRSEPAPADDSPQDLSVKKPRGDKEKAVVVPQVSTGFPVQEKKEEPGRKSKRKRSVDSSSESGESVGGVNGTTPTGRKTLGKLDSILSNLKKRKESGKEKVKEVGVVNGQGKEKEVDVEPVAAKPPPVATPPRTSTPAVRGPSPPAPHPTSPLPAVQWDQLLATLPPLDTTPSPETQRSLARKLKSEADQLDKKDANSGGKRSAIYLQSVVHFALMGLYSEKNPKQAMELYHSTINMLNHCRLPHPPTGDTTLLLRVTRYLHFRALAVLSTKIYGFNEDRAMKIGRNVEHAKKHPPQQQPPSARTAVSKSPSPSPGTSQSPYSVGSTGSGTGSDKPQMNGTVGATPGAGNEIPGLGEFHQLSFALVNGWWYWNRGKDMVRAAGEASAEAKAFEEWLQGKAPLRVDAGIEELAKHLYTALWVLRALPEGR